MGGRGVSRMAYTMESGSPTTQQRDEKTDPVALSPKKPGTSTVSIWSLVHAGSLEKAGVGQPMTVGATAVLTRCGGRQVGERSEFLFRLHYFSVALIEHKDQSSL